jgi:hypothetical protein
LPNLSIQRPVKCRFLTYAENERLEATGERPDDVTTHWIINWRTLMQDAPPISKLVGRVVELPAVPRRSDAERQRSVGGDRVGTGGSRARPVVQ